MVKLHFELTLDEAKELRKLLNRALNCLEPDKWSKFDKDLETAVESFIKKHEND